MDRQLFPEFAKKKDDKNAKINFIKQQKKERLEREKLKQRINAVNLIISFYRRTKQYYQFKKQLFTEFNQKYKDIMKLQSILDQQKFQILIFQALNQFKIFYRVLVMINNKSIKYDIEIILGLQTLMSYATQTNQFQINLLSGLFNKEQMNLTMYRIRKVINLGLTYINIVQKVNKNQDISNVVQQNSQYLFRLINKKFLIKNWKASELLKNYDDKQIKEIKLQIFSKIDMAEILLFINQNQEFFFKDQFKAYQIILIKILKYNRNEQNYPQLLQEISKIANTFKFLLDQKPKILNKFMNIFDEKNYEQLIFSQNISPEKIKNMIINFQFLLKNGLKNQDTHIYQLRNLLLTIKQLIELYIEKQNAQQQLQNKNQMEIEEENQKQNDSFEYQEIKLNKKNKENYQNLEFLDMQILLADELLIKISQCIQNDCYDSTKSIDKNLEFVSQISDYFLKILKTNKHQKINTLIRLSFSYDFVQQLFNTLNILKFDYLRIVEKKLYTNNILHLFCKLLYHSIRMMDDSEFFNKLNQNDHSIKKNLSVDNLIIVSEFINNFAYKQYFKEQDFNFLFAKNSIIKLIQELFNRDSRNKYTQKEQFWVIKDADSLYHNNSITKLEDNQELISELPQIFSYPKRFVTLRKLIHSDYQNHDRNPYAHMIDDEDQTDIHMNSLNIRRNYEIEDGFLFLKNRNLKNAFSIKFIDEMGNEEQGQDGGGLFKEFLTTISKKLFDPNFGYFIETEDKTLIPNPHANLMDNSLQMFKFMGKIVGKAIYENILIEPVFSRAFLNKILGRNNDFEELAFVDQTVYKNLLLLKHTNNMADYLGMNFTIDQDVFGEKIQLELKKEGKDIEVTEQNKLEYILLYSDFKLNKQMHYASVAFQQGFQSVIDPKWLKMFNHDELQLLISGKQGFDVKDLQNNCVVNYKVPNEQKTTIDHLFSILNEYNEEDKAEFLSFVTGCTRPPSLGFRDLDPKFCIQIEKNSDNLPISHTCMNMLRIPDYQDKDKLQQKLTYAIKSKSGFYMP